MKLTSKIKQAIDTSARLHINQKRKSSGIPYISHPYGVAFIVENYTQDEDVVAAALLHDVLEDVSKDLYDETAMRQDFGDRVTDFVKEVSEDKALPSWQARKQAYYEHLKTASPEALLISAADLTHNLVSMLEAYAAQGKVAWQAFEVPVQEKLASDAARIAKIKQRLDSPVTDELSAAYKELELIVNRT